MDLVDRTDSNVRILFAGGCEVTVYREGHAGARGVLYIKTLQIVEWI